MNLTIPEKLARTCSTRPDRREWLSRLPEVVAELQARWSLSLGEPYEAAQASWVAPVTDQPAVLKVGMPHMEADHEIDGMRFWDGEPTTHLLEFDVEGNAMLLERCDPGTPLGDQPEPEQDVILAGLLQRLWREPPEPNPFRSLSILTQRWNARAREKAGSWVDTGLVEEGMRLFEELPRTASQHVLLATDLHAGNVLQAQREPWLVIDPKPFVGDPAYDATQHLFNCRERLCAQTLDTINRFADLLEVDRHRVRAWVFARAIITPWDHTDPTFLAIARGCAS
ncbi:MAG: aminoglycoside phosphotransferase family protein [Candidatus Latescibacterota bacterium]